jgi:hypothetical protein
LAGGLHHFAKFGTLARQDLKSDVWRVLFPARFFAGFIDKPKYRCRLFSRRDTEAGWQGPRRMKLPTRFIRGQGILSN